MTLTTRVLKGGREAEGRWESCDLEGPAPVALASLGPSSLYKAGMAISSQAAENKDLGFWVSEERNAARQRLDFSVVSPHQTSGLQTSKLIGLCHLKPVSLW